MSRLSFIIGISILASSLMMTPSCRSGCADLICFNSGVCKDGACICQGRYGGAQCDTLCPVGREGLYCDVDSRDKFIGTWQADTRDESGNHIFHQLTVSANPSFGSMRISNYNNQGFNCNANILEPKIFNIPTQTVSGAGIIVSGSGYKNGEQLAIDLTINGQQYFAVCMKQ